MLQEQPASEPIPFDSQELLDRCMGNIDLAERVLAKLQSRFEKETLELEQALQTKDCNLIAGIAHRLKGAAANVAAHDLRQCAANIEDLARKEQFDQMPEQLDLLRDEWSRLNQATLSWATR
jgi:HPt (histidine-containing phosphotransfer) domain-containing protein